MDGVEEAFFDLVGIVYFVTLGAFIVCILLITGDLGGRAALLSSFIL